MIKNKNCGFTLLEILLVVGIIAILAGIVIMAINPSRQLAQARNTERKSDLKQINSALQQYYIDQREYPDTLTGTLTEICDTGAATSSSEITTLCSVAGLIDLSVLVPAYLTAIPVDPQASTTNGAGYQAVRHSSRRIGLSAPGELGQVITINIPEEEVDACGDATNQDCWSADDITSGESRWSLNNVRTNAQSNTDGRANTATIMTFSTGGNYPAAEACYNLIEGGHDDWFLPAKQQLIDAFNSGITGFQIDYYWSSTEYEYEPELEALYGAMGGGFAHQYQKSGLNYVRCLR